MATSKRTDKAYRNRAVLVLRREVGRAGWMLDVDGYGNGNTPGQSMRRFGTGSRNHVPRIATPTRRSSAQSRRIVRSCHTCDIEHCVG